MTQYRLVHVPTEQTVAFVDRAENWWVKGWGVLGRRTLSVGRGLWLPDVASVHTVFVRFPLDLLFLDMGFQAIRLVPCTPPGRWLIRAAGACHTLELGAGTLTSAMSIGDGWRLEPIAPQGVLKEGEAL